MSLQLSSASVPPSVLKSPSRPITSNSASVPPSVLQSPPLIDPRLSLNRLNAQTVMNSVTPRRPPAFISGTTSTPNTLSAFNGSTSPRGLSITAPTSSGLRIGSPGPSRKRDATVAASSTFTSQLGSPLVSSNRASLQPSSPGPSRARTEIGSCRYGTQDTAVLPASPLPSHLPNRLRGSMRFSSPVRSPLPGPSTANAEVVRYTTQDTAVLTASLTASPLPSHMPNKLQSVRFSSPERSASPGASTVNAEVVRYTTQDTAILTASPLPSHIPNTSRSTMRFSSPARSPSLGASTANAEVVRYTTQDTAILTASPQPSHIPKTLNSSVRFSSPVRSASPGASATNAGVVRYSTQDTTVLTASPLTSQIPSTSPTSMRFASAVNSSLAASARHHLREESTYSPRRESIASRHQSVAQLPNAAERLFSTAVCVQPIQQEKSKEQIVSDAFTQAIQDTRQRSSCARRDSPSPIPVVRQGTVAPMLLKQPPQTQTPLSSPLPIMPTPLASPLLVGGGSACIPMHSTPQPVGKAVNFSGTGFLDNPVLQMPHLMGKQQMSEVKLPAFSLSGSAMAAGKHLPPQMGPQVGTFLHTNGDTQMLPRDQSEYLSPSEYSFVHAGLESNTEYGKPLPPAPGEGGDDHNLSITANGKSYDALTFSSADDLQQSATLWLQMNGLDSAFRKGLVSQMRQMVNTKLRTAGVDLLDLL